MQGGGGGGGGGIYMYTQELIILKKQTMCKLEKPSFLTDILQYAYIVSKYIL